MATTTREERRTHANVAIVGWPMATCGETVQRILGYMDEQEEGEHVVPLDFEVDEHWEYRIFAMGGQGSDICIRLMIGRPWGISNVECTWCARDLHWCSATTPRRDTRLTSFFDIQKNAWVEAEHRSHVCDWRTAAELLMGKHLKPLRECKDGEITFRCPCRDET